MKKAPVLKLYLAYRFYIFPAVIALASFFLVITVIYPQSVKLIENQKLVDNIISKTQFLSTKAQALESYNKEDLSQKVVVVLNSLPADKQYGRVIDLLQSLVVQSGFTVTSISFDKGSGKIGDASSFGVSLSVTGPRGQFQTLLSGFDNSPLIMRVNNLDISSSQSLDVLNANISMEVLYSPIPQSLGTVDSPLPELSQKDEELVTTLKGSVAAPVNTSVVSTSPRGKANPFD